MKKYLKMSDYFITGTFSADYGDVHSVIKYKPSADCLTSRVAHYAVEHAINSHDELVEINKELLKTLKNALEECEFEIRHGGKVCVDTYAIRKAIEMAEGGAA